MVRRWPFTLELLLHEYPRAVNVRKRETGNGRETILVVDDTEDVRKMICQILLYDGYTVLEAADGDEALKICGANGKNIHLILTDLIMPRMNGHELAEHIRRTKPATRLLFMSGYMDDPLVHTFNNKTIFLPKPFTPSDLVQKVRQVLDGPGLDSSQTR